MATQIHKPTQQSIIQNIGGKIKTPSERVRNIYDTDKIIIDNLVSSMDVVDDFSDWYHGEYMVKDKGFAEQFEDMTLEEIQPIVAETQKEFNTFRTDADILF